MVDDARTSEPTEARKECSNTGRKYLVGLVQELFFSIVLSFLPFQEKKSWNEVEDSYLICDSEKHRISRQEGTVWDRHLQKGHLRY